MNLTTGTRLGPYEIVDVLGAGGMGVVYKARDPHLNRPVALKVLRSGEVTPERRARFLQEARAASALNHPHIVHVYDVARAADDDFIVMEYVEGESLDRLISSRALPPRDTVRFAVQIADALATAHSAGIVHRDLKPGNIIITPDTRTRQPVAKLLDFGIAKLTEQPHAQAAATTRTTPPETTDGTLLGSVAYMSPEQAEGKTVDARSDIFSFGTMLSEMVTGRHPFARSSTLATLSAILHEEPVPAGQLTEGVPEELCTLIERCLRKDPRRRVQVMDDVKIILEDILEEWPAVRRGGKEDRVARRRWRRVAVIGTVAGMLTAGALTLGYFAATPAMFDTSAFRYTPFATEPYFEGYPAWSPDGRTIAYVADIAGERHILARSLDAAVRRRSRRPHSSHHISSGHMTAVASISAGGTLPSGRSALRGAIPGWSSRTRELRRWLRTAGCWHFCAAPAVKAVCGSCRSTVANRSTTGRRRSRRRLPSRWGCTFHRMGAGLRCWWSRDSGRRSRRSSGWFPCHQAPPGAFSSVSRTGSVMRA